MNAHTFSIYLSRRRRVPKSDSELSSDVCSSDLVLREFVCFFFSSRRRHTRSDRDWSSDVCSSDLGVAEAVGREQVVAVRLAHRVEGGNRDLRGERDRAARGGGGDGAVIRVLGKQIGRASCRERV